MFVFIIAPYIILSTVFSLFLLVTVQTIVKTDEILKNIFVDKLKQDEKSR